MKIRNIIFLLLSMILGITIGYALQTSKNLKTLQDIYNETIRIIQNNYV